MARNGRGAVPGRVKASMRSRADSSSKSTQGTVNIELAAQSQALMKRQAPACTKKLMTTTPARWARGLAGETSRVTWLGAYRRQKKAKPGSRRTTITTVAQAMDMNQEGRVEWN